MIATESERPMRDVVELPHGYTLAQAEQLARAAACTVHTGSTETVADKIDHAWSIIVATLYEAPAQPSTGQLVWAARKSLYREDRDRLKDYGYADRNVANGAASGSSFRTYWYRPTASIEHDLIERHTFAQIWPLLTDRDRQVLVALAVYGNATDGAAAIGIPRSSFHMYLSEARKRFLKRWHAGETPSKHWGMNHPGNGGLGAGSNRHQAECPCAVCNVVRRKTA
jgi:hypothetical protein